MKVVIGITGVAVGLAAGLGIFLLGGAFGFALSEIDRDKAEKEEEK